MRLFFAAVIAVIIALTGWWIWHEVAEPDSGTIVRKSHSPTIITTQCHPVGKVTTCTPLIIPECWDIDYRDSAGRDGDACVSQTAWDRYEVGANYP